MNFDKTTEGFSGSGDPVLSSGDFKAVDVVFRVAQKVAVVAPVDWSKGRKTSLQQG